jgi:hypothetical protein
MPLTINEIITIFSHADGKAQSIYHWQIMGLICHMMAERLRLEFAHIIQELSATRLPI